MHVQEVLEKMACIPTLHNWEGAVTRTGLTNGGFKRRVDGPSDVAGQPVSYEASS
jgi:hypothetical protein